MYRHIIWLLFFAVGVAAGFYLGNRHASPRPADAPVARVTRSVTAAPLAVHAPQPKLSARQVQTHRDDNYRTMKSVDDILELPNDFTQTEALYALAGRADIATLHSYIEQALAITNRYDRRAALHILYLRYSEISPHAALEHLASIDLDIERQIVHGIFESWAKEDVNAAIAAANAMPNSSRRRRAGAAILQAYAQADPGMLSEISSRLEDAFDTALYEAQAIGSTASHSPRLALEQALALPGDGARYRALSNVGRVWARTDPQGAFAHATTLSARRDRSLFLEAVVSQWIEEDPSTAVDALMALPDGHQKQQLLNTATFALTEQNPAQAYEFANLLPGNLRDSAMQRVVDRWMQVDSAAALAAVMNQPESRQKDFLLASAGGRYAERDPSGALSWAAELPDGQREIVYAQMLSQVAKKQPEQALAIALAVEGPKRNRTLMSVMQHVSQQNPELAATYLDQLPAGNLRMQAVSTIASVWAGQDTGAALDWVSSFDGATYDQAISQISYQVAQHDPDAAAAYVDRLRPESRASWVRSVASVYASQDPQRAIAFARRFANDSLFDPAMTAVVVQMAYTDPTRALSMTTGLNESSRQQATHQVVSQWAARDPAAAAQWVESQRGAIDNDALLSNIAGQWANHDPVAAARWTLARPAGAQRDAMLLGLLLNNVPSSDEALRLVNAIRDDQSREQAVLSTYMRMHQRPSDRAAAAAFLARAGLSPEQRQRIEMIATNGHSE